MRRLERRSLGGAVEKEWEAEVFGVEFTGDFEWIIWGILEMDDRADL